MTDLDELSRLLEQSRQDGEWQDFNQAKKRAAEELIRDARRYRWVIDLAEFWTKDGHVCVDDSVEDKGRWIDEAIAQESLTSAVAGPASS